MAARKGRVHVSVGNGLRDVQCRCDVIEMPTRRDLVIGLSHFKNFGFNLSGVPALPNHISTDLEHLGEVSDDEEYLEFDNYKAADLSNDVTKALSHNQKLPLSSRCTHPLAVLRIEPSDTSPIWSRVNFVSPKNTDEVNAEVMRWLEAGVIERAPDDCGNSFPILCVPKKDAKGSKVDIRACVDLRRLNKRLPDNDYPLPKVQDILDEVGSARGPDAIYTTLDIRDGYFRFTIPEENRNYIAFVWRGVHYRFCAAPFEVKPMSAKFQQLMDKIFLEVPFVAVYVDDIVIFSRSRAEHVEHVRFVIELLTKFSLLIRVDKSRFGQSAVRLLGFIITGKGIQKDPTKVSAISNWERPDT
eukprot:IDg6806t1